MRSLSFFTPHSIFGRQITEELDRCFNEFMKPFGSAQISFAGKTLGGYPRINAFQKDGKCIIEAYTPYAKPEDISIEIVEDDILKIEINSHQDSEINDNDYIVREISRGQTKRLVRLGESVNKDSIKAELKDGVLKIVFDIAEQKLPETKKIPIDYQQN